MKRVIPVLKSLPQEAGSPNTKASKFTKLLFEWPIKKAPRLTLSLFIFLAVLLHLSTIYLFNIVYEAPHVNKPIAAQVFFLLPHSAASVQLTPWLEANDPAVFSPLRTVQASRPKIVSSIYEPSQPPPSLHPLPFSQEDKMASLLPPTHEIELPPSSLFPSSSSSKKENAPTPAITTKTTLRLLENLRERAPVPASLLVPPSLPKGITTPLTPTTLTVNIDALGSVRHAIILHSSGSEEADEAATHWAMTSHFAPAAEESWGTLLILWGSKE